MRGDRHMNSSQVHLKRGQESCLCPARAFVFVENNVFFLFTTTKPYLPKYIGDPEDTSLNDTQIAFRFFHHLPKKVIQERNFLIVCKNCH